MDGLSQVLQPKSRPQSDKCVQALGVVSMARVPGLGAARRGGWRSQKWPLPLLRLKPLKQERKKKHHTCEQPRPKPCRRKQERTWQRALALS